MQKTLFTCAAILVCNLVFSAHARQDDPAYVKPDTSKDSQDDDSTQVPGVILQQDDSGTIEGFGRLWRGLKRLERIQFLANITTIRNSTPLLPFHDSDHALDLGKARPFPLSRSEVDPLLGSPLSPIMSPIRNMESYLSDSAGMNFGIYYTLLYQHVTDPIAGTPADLGTGRFDFNLVWNLWEYPVEGHLNESGMGHGLMGILVRQGNQIGVPNSVNTTESVGSTQGLNSLYTGDAGGEATLNLLYYQQGFLNDRFVVSVGKLHPNQYIGLNFWANDESRQFIAGPFDGIQTLGPSQGGYQLGVAVQAVPADWCFINAMVTDALGTPQTMFGTLNEGYYWAAVEAGFILPFPDDMGGPSALSLIWTRQNIDVLAPDPTRRTSNSIAMQLQGHLSDDIGYWAQGGVAEPHMSSIEAQFSIGLGLERPFGRRGDYAGAAFNWSKPSSGIDAATPGFTIPPTEQSMFELFYRIQLTGSCQLTPDVQIVLDPGERSGGGSSVVFGLRLTTDF